MPNDETGGPRMAGRMNPGMIGHRHAVGTVIVVYGTDFESCSSPAWGSPFGSGVRAVPAVDSLSRGTRLSTHAYRERSGDLRATMAASDVSSEIFEIAERL